MNFKIIIPLLNEEIQLQKISVINFLKQFKDNIQIVDSASTDNTLGILKSHDLNWISYIGAPSIAGAVKFACEKINDQYILILPIDCFIGDTQLKMLNELIIEKANIKWGGYLKEYTQTNTFIKVYLFLQNRVRTQLLKNLVWTNGIFCQRQLYLNCVETPGFLEDVILCDVLKKYEKPIIFKKPIISSFRRYDGQLGKRVFTNLKIMILYRLKLRSISELKTIYLD